MKHCSITLLVIGQLGQALHHYRVYPFWADVVGETFGIISVIGICVTALFLVEMGADN